MDKLHVITSNNKFHKKSSGFSLIDSMVALVIFGVVTGLYFKQTEDVNIYKNAKVYANQTNVYARDLADQMQVLKPDTPKYPKNMLFTTKNYEKNNVFIGSPNTIKLYQLDSYDGKSLYKETPCLAMYYDSHSTLLNNGGFGELHAIMYYTSPGNNGKYKEKTLLRALAYNGGYSVGYFAPTSKVLSTTRNTLGNGIISNNGWSPPQRVLDYISTNKCGGNVLSKNSLITNEAMFPSFNNRLITMNGLQRSQDQSYGASNLVQYLPNHLGNKNTLKSNLQLGTLVGDGTLTLKNATTSGGDDAITLGLSKTAMDSTLKIGTSDQDDNKTMFLVNSIQPTSSMANGSACNPTDVGKVGIEQNSQITTNGVATKLARSLVTCTNNPTLCSTLNGQGTGYCYLPVKARTTVFNAGADGDLSTNGDFVCPAYAPFLSDAKTVTGTTGVNYDVYDNVICKFKPFFGGSEFEDLCSRTTGFYSSKRPLRTVSPITRTITAPSGEINISYLTKDYVTQNGTLSVRYGVSGTNSGTSNTNCNLLCSSAGGTVGTPPSFTDTNTFYDVCFCGTFAVTMRGNFNGLISQATCSTTPDYQVN